MKNRRLNVLFIAIIALAAAPQLLQDARRLASAVEDRAENEFWSIFLSYQTPNAKGLEARGKTELLAEQRKDVRGNCPLQRMAAQVVEATSNLKTSDSRLRTRFISESKRASAKARAGVVAPQIVEPSDDDNAIASLDAVRPIEFSERERSALNSARLHARDSEKLSGQLPKPAMAFSWQENDDVQMKIRPVMEINKFLRRKARDTKERSNASRELPEPPSEEGM